MDVEVKSENGVPGLSIKARRRQISGWNSRCDRQVDRCEGLCPPRPTGLGSVSGDQAVTEVKEGTGVTWLKVCCRIVRTDSPEGGRWLGNKV